MRHAPSPPLSGWRSRAVAFAALALLTGCANADFGEVNPTLVRDDMHDWVAREAVAGQHAKLSHFELTDDERQLRDLAYPLIEPPYDRQQWYSVLGEYGLIGAERRRTFDRTAYAAHLQNDGVRSPAARYARLGDDVRNDTTRLPQFFETASRVIDIDQKRRRSLAYVSALSPDERKNALRRINENAAIVAWVRESLARRVASYRYALERLVIATPSAQAVDVERAINQLQAAIARYRHPVPTWKREQSLASAR